MSSFRALFMQRIHPLNWPFLFVVSFWRPVWYWHFELLPARLLKRFVWIDPQDYFTRPEWIKSEEVAREKFLRSREYGTKKIISISSTNTSKPALQVDITPVYLQNVAKVFLETQQFSFLTAAQIEPVETVFYLSRYFTFVPASSRLFALLDRVWLRAKVVLQVFRRIIEIRKKQTITTQVPYGRIENILLAVPPIAVSNKENQLDSLFWFRRNILDPSKTILCTQGPLSKDRATHLQALGADYIDEHRVVHFYDKKTKTKLARSLLRIIFSAEDSFILSAPINICLWQPFVEANPLKAAISSNSAFWPAPALLCLLNSLKVRTVTWFYSANQFESYPQHYRLSEKSLTWCISASQELLLWNGLQKRNMARREIPLAGHKTVFHEVGPLMFGDSKWLCKSVLEARQEIGLSITGKKIIGVFDMPTKVPAVRKRTGLGPLQNPDELPALLFRDLKEILRQHPDLLLLLKPKREFGGQDELVNHELDSLLAENSEFRQRGQILTMPFDIDPFIPIAVSDFCIAPPFSSPVLAAIQFSRPAVFYDSTNQLLCTMPEELGKLTVHGQEQLRKTISDWLANPRAFWQTQHQAIADLLPPPVDPLELTGQLFKARQTNEVFPKEEHTINV